MEALQAAQRGVLFVDEAYRLTEVVLRRAAPSLSYCSFGIEMHMGIVQNTETIIW